MGVPISPSFRIQPLTKQALRYISNSSDVNSIVYSSDTMYFPDRMIRQRHIVMKNMDKNAISQHYFTLRDLRGVDHSFIKFASYGMSGLHNLLLVLRLSPSETRWLHSVAVSLLISPSPTSSTRHIFFRAGSAFYAAITYSFGQVAVCFKGHHRESGAESQAC